MKTKVFHCWNTAGIGGLLSRYMDRAFDYDSVCLMRKYADPFGLTTEKVRLVDCGAKEFVIRSIIMAHKADIVHVHGALRVFPILRRIFPKKKMIMHFHGTKIRGKWQDYDWIDKKADVILVSTEDLLEGSPKKTIWLPNIVDEQLIYHISGSIGKRKKKAFHCVRFAGDIAKEYAKAFDIGVDFWDRDKQPLDHFDFLRKMSRYEFVIDVKREFPKDGEQGKVLQAMSLTGLEALRLGCQVIRYDGYLTSKFPEWHEVKKVIKQLDDIYRNWGK